MNRKYIIKIIISFFLLYYIIHDVNFDEILNSIKYANTDILIFAFSLHFIGLMLSSIRWKVLLNSQNVKSGLLFLFKSYLIATFFNHFLPSTIGGDSIRTYDSWRLGENREKAFAVIILDRFLGLLTLIIFAIIAMLVSPDIGKVLPNLWIGLVILSIGAIVLIWFIFSPPTKLFKIIQKKNVGVISKVSGFIYKIDIAFSQFVNKKRYIFYSLFLSFLLQFNVVFYYFAISYALNLKVLLIDYFLVVPLTVFVTMIPISFNGLGLRENALFLFLAPLGVLQSQAIAFAWIEYLMLILLGLIGGIIYMFRK